MGRAVPGRTVSSGTVPSGGRTAGVAVVGGAAAVDRVVGPAPDRAADPGGGPERVRPEPHPGPEEACGPVIGAGVRHTGADGEPVPAGRAGSGAGARAGLAGPRDPGSGREPLPEARGPAGGPVSDRLARARQVLHRTETRADVAHVRPVARPGCGSPPTAPSAAAPAAQAVGTAEPADTALLPVPGPLAGLLPFGGLRRGSTVAVGAGAGAGSLLFALLAAASAEGAWAGVVGRPGLGAAAAAEAGVQLDRLALVPEPGADVVGVTAALLDGLDLVAVAGPERSGLRAGDRQRLMARARQRGAVLLALGSWPGADLRLHCERPRWEGVGRGAGRLRHRRVEVRASGRGIGPAGVGAEVLLPGPGGVVAAVTEVTTTTDRPLPVTGAGAAADRPIVRVAG